MSKITAEVKKLQNENSTNLLRRFSKRVQESGLINTIKANRYSERLQSKVKTKKIKLKKLQGKVMIEKLKKMGKPLPARKNGRR